MPSASSPHRSPLRSPLRTLARTGARLLAPAVLAAALVTSSLAGPASAAASAATAPNPVTPGNLTGFAFDQCLAPTQSAMDTWLSTSPFLAVGVYISGDSRACRDQPHLTPSWVRTQLAKGWRLLPITLGPQASCNPRFPRYRDDVTINPRRGNGHYTRARRMGQASATSTVADAKALGITAGSTLWYDMEGFDSSDTACRESALAFLSAWTTKLHSLGFVSGVYSSAGSGIAALDDARVDRPSAFDLPDRIWMARWDGVASTSTSYVRDAGWRPGGRVKQYEGGHDETWGGVRINIDRSYVDLGTGSVAAPEKHCSGLQVNFRAYQPLAPATASATPPADQVEALQCLLRERGVFKGDLNGYYGSRTVRAAHRWQTLLGFSADKQKRWFLRDWMTLASYGRTPVVKVGSSGFYVRRVQRALDATGYGYRLWNTGTVDLATGEAIKDYQKRRHLRVSGIVDAATWAALMHGVNG